MARAGRLLSQLLRNSQVLTAVKYCLGAKSGSDVEGTSDSLKTNFPNDGAGELILRFCDARMY
jgi:hypothetical protein